MLPDDDSQLKYIVMVNSVVWPHILYAATPPNWPRRCTLTDDSDCFSNSNFSKAQTVHSLMMVIKPNHVGGFLM